MTNPLLSSIADALHESMSGLRERITEVKYGFTPDLRHNCVTFKLDGKRYTGVLRGRNRDLIPTGNVAHDQAIALRSFLDGDAIED